MVNYQIMQFQMKKEEKSFHDLPKPRSIYKYELKATNEIFTDTVDLCRSVLLSTTHTNRNHLKRYDQDIQRTPSRLEYQTPYKRSYVSLLDHSLKEGDSSHLGRFNQSSRQIFEDYQFGKRQIRNKKKEKSSQWQYLDRDAFINSEIYSFSEDNLSNPPKKPQTFLTKTKLIPLKRNTINELKKDLKRQRRGLADISLKVKNIVALMGKMTFKEVSDEVLKQSQEDLPSQTQEREKQTKNIRRRVYDALNVLVSVGILGKEQRCVVHTQFTNVRGKKLSEHYDLVAQRNRSLDQQIQNYRKKLDNLLLLKKNYETLILFHDRNRQYLKESQKEPLTDKTNKVQIFCKTTCDRLFFPLIFLLPPKVMTQKIKIQIDYQDNTSQIVRKFVIEGTDYILTDLDTLKYLNLPTINNAQVSPTPEKLLRFISNQQKHVIAIQSEQSESLSLDYGENEGDEEIYLSD